MCSRPRTCATCSAGRSRSPWSCALPPEPTVNGAAHHSHSLESWFSFIPGIKVVLPSDAHDAKGLLISAIRDDNFVLYLEHKKLYDKKADVPEEPFTIPLGKAAVKRTGTALTIVAWSFMVTKALEAAAALEKRGISVEVIDLRTVSPLDEETILASVEKTGKLLVVQETYRHCSVATDVSALVAEKGFDLLDAPIRLITARDVPIPFAPVMENYVLPQTETIVAEAEKLVNDVREA